jgi:hypothetical protein
VFDKGGEGMGQEGLSVGGSVEETRRECVWVTLKMIRRMDMGVGAL